MQNEKISVKRIEYLDVAKALLIALVVFGHVLIVLNPDYSKIMLSCVQSFICSFHMPAFFIIHGILFNNEKWKETSVKEFIVKRLYSMIIPYIFFEVVGIVWKAIFAKQSISTGLYYMFTVRCNVGADWFLPALFMGSLLYLIYVKHPNRMYGVISVVSSFVFPMIMPHSQVMVVIGRGLLAYGFIMIGNIGKKFFLSENTKKIVCLAIALLVTGIVAIVSLKWGGNDFYSCVVNNPFTFILGGISGTYLALGISQYFQSKIIANVGKHTLAIMGTHQLVIYAMTAVVPELKGGTFLMGIGLMTSIFIFEIPVVYVIKQYLPLCIGKTKVK